MRKAAASALAYAALTAFFARDLLANLGGRVAGDRGDPLFVAGILHWNATTLPLTEEWWQLPIFYPTRDALTFSEHFLGLMPVAAPLHWIVGDAVVTYNVATLLTFPLCGLAMFALVHRLTRNGIAAFLAGLAFAFAPYRISHVPHLQMLAFFWAPLALVGLHAYLESGARRWLLLYGAAWMLQGATNGYALVFLSVLVAFWVVWFVVARKKWAALAAITLATLLAAAPLLPVVAKYVSVHALHGFERGMAEMRAYSADLTAVLCAPPNLTFWGWLRTGCRPEGELFPGLAAAAAGVLAWLWLPAGPAAGRESRALALARRLLIAAALASAAVAVSVALAGPWALHAGPLRISASSAPKPVMLAIATMFAALALSPRVRTAARASSTTGFYVIAVVLTWVLALGPTLTFMGEPRGFQAPFALLTWLPGVSGLRVPARFWLLTTMCLAVLVGLTAARLVDERPRAVRWSVAAAGAALLLTDGWVARLPVAAVFNGVPDPRALRGATVLALPMDSLRDIAAGFDAVTGGWRSVNGYSGYFPSYYAALTDALRDHDQEGIAPFLERGDLHVVVDANADGSRRMVERQPGAVVTAFAAGAIQYRLPRRAALPRVDAGGERLQVRDVRASCDAANARHAVDGNERTRWNCGPQRPGQELLVDLGRPSALGGILQDFTDYHYDYPHHLRVETSVDGVAWDVAWDGSVRRLLIAQALDRPGRSLRLALPLAARTARYIRLRQVAPDPQASWSLAELEVWRARPR